jgi:hypothetical protein
MADVKDLGKVNDVKGATEPVKAARKTRTAMPRFELVPRGITAPAGIEAPNEADSDDVLGYTSVGYLRTLVRSIPAKVADLEVVTLMTTATVIG